MRSGKLPVERIGNPGFITLNPNGKTGDGISIHVRRSCKLWRCADHISDGRASWGRSAIDWDEEGRRFQHIDGHRNFRFDERFLRSRSIRFLGLLSLRNLQGIWTIRLLDQALPPDPVPRTISKRTRRLDHIKTAETNMIPRITSIISGNSRR